MIKFGLTKLLMNANVWLTDSNEEVSERHKNEAEVEDEKGINYEEEEDNSDKAESDEAEEENRGDAHHNDQEFEEVVNIRPDQSSEDSEEEDDGNSDEEERHPGFEDEEMERPDVDNHMMVGHEGDLEDPEISYDEGIEGFRRVS